MMEGMLQQPIQDYKMVTKENHQEDQSHNNNLTNTVDNNQNNK